MGYPQREDGFFVFATDETAYADWVKEILKEVPDLVLQELPQNSFPFPEYIPTYFEQKWRSMGRTINYLVCRK